MRTLAIDPTTKGLCYAVLEGSEVLVAWGCMQVAGDRQSFSSRVEALVERFCPDLVVLEEPSGSRRGKRARRRVALTAELATSRGVEVAFVSRQQVRDSFGEAGVNKWETANAIVRLFPELERRLPPHQRKPWESEPEAMNLFDAVSFALAVLWPREREKWRERQAA